MSRPRRAIALREHDIERHSCGTTVTQSVDESTDDIATPWPLANATEALLVDVHDHDFPAWLARRRPPYEPVIDRELEIAQGGRPREREQRSGQRGSDAAQQKDPAISRAHRTVISTRRFLGSETLSAVGTSNVASP